MLPATVRLKEGVSPLKDAHPQIRLAIDRAAEVAGFYLREIVLTSLNDSKHRNNSFHYSDRAVDIRSKNFPDMNTKKKFLADLADDLGCTDKRGPLDYWEHGGNGFRILLERPGTENEHFHLEWRGD